MGRVLALDFVISNLCMHKQCVPFEPGDETNSSPPIVCLG